MSTNGQHQLGRGRIEQRRGAILTRLQEQDFIQTSYLSRLLGISEVTIRKDLEFLEQRGFLKRSHGGAQLADNALSLLDLSERYMLNRSAKEQIVREAIKLLQQPGLYIYVDTGTTNLLLARAIPRDLPITVITNSFSTIMALEGRSSCRVITLGGVVDYQYKIFQGPWTDAQLERFSFDFLFAGADSVSEEGFGCSDLVQSELLRKAISRARATYVLADSSKVDKRANNIYAKPAEMTGWITDSKVNPVDISHGALTPRAKKRKKSLSVRRASARGFINGVNESLVKAFEAKGGKVIVAE